MSNWQPIETAPREMKQRGDGYWYGVHILVWPFYGEVVRARWWQSADSDGKTRCNFIADGGNACYPTHWMPVPDPPRVVEHLEDVTGEEEEV